MSPVGAELQAERDLSIVIDGTRHGRIVVTRHDGASGETLFEGAGFVFVSSTGSFVNPANIQNRHFLPILKKADLPHIRFHDFRHCCATLCLSLNIHPKVVQERLGHSTIVRTLKTYSHVIETTQEESRQKLNKFFERLMER
jgi:integrase